MMINARGGDRVLVRVPGRKDWHSGTVVVSGTGGRALGIEMDDIFTFPATVGGMVGCFATKSLAVTFVNDSYQEVSNGQDLEIKRDDGDQIAQSA